jgi:hypothetical protein
MNIGSVAWWTYRDPFRHFRARDVLDSNAYQQICSEFSAIADTTQGGRDGAYRLARTNPKYDALMLGVDSNLAPSFAPFFSRDWFQYLYRLIRLPELLRIDGGLHSSPEGSGDGWIHSDLCSGWFDESSAESGPFPNRKKCDYFSGKARTSDAKPVEYVRAATMIYYLCNDGWCPGDGGETGLYASSRLGANAPVELVQPLNNSLLLFECSPHSYHRFVANPGRVRNSIILWLHATVERSVSTWGNAINRRGS